MRIPPAGSARLLLVLLAVLLARPSLPAPPAAPLGVTPLPAIRSARLFLFQGNRLVGQLLLRAQPTQAGDGFVVVGRFLGLQPGVYQAQALGFTNLNGSGLPVAHAAGTAAVTARQTVILRLQWELIRRLQRIAVTPVNPAVRIGEFKQFTATGFFNDGSQEDITQSVVWRAINQQVARVGNGGPGDLLKGLARGLSQGSTVITATDPVTHIQGSTRLTVRRLISIEVTPADQTILVGQNLQYTATGTFNDGSQQDITGSVNWSSSNTSVATISNGGVDAPPAGEARGQSPGNTTITATDPFSGTQGSTSLAVRILIAITVTPANQTILVGQSIQYTATGTFSDGSQQDLTSSVNWSTGNPSVAAISNGSPNPLPKGQATGVGPGSTTITATDPATSIQGSTSLTVQTPPPVLVSIVVTPANQTIFVGQSIQYTATGNYSNGSQQDLTNTVNWSSGNTSAATISNGGPSAPPKGQATGVGPGVTTITATDPATNIQGSTSLTVQTPPPTLVSITVTPANQTITVGFSIQYTATGNFSNGSQQDLTNTVNWSSSNPTVAAISNGSPNPAPKGQATGLAPGNTIITATDPATNIQGSTGLTVTFSTP